MDDQNKPQPPPDHEVAGLEKDLPGATAGPDETRPVRPVARDTHQGLPPLPDPHAGRAMPGTPDTRTAPPSLAVAESGEDAGLQRVIDNMNLDAVGQADPNAEPDRYSAEALQNIVAGGSIPVPVNSIDRELIQVWKSTTSGGDNEGKVSVTLMRAMNLVVYVEEEARTAQANEVISRVIGRHPCRTIMIVNRSGANSGPPPEDDKGQEGDLDAHLSAHCQLAGAGGRHICCEQVSILANTPSGLSRVSNLALNLLITDLPVFLWWAAGEPLNNMVLTHLIDSIDRLIVDSSTFTDPLAGLLALSRSVDPAFNHNERARYAAGDLNWGRLEGWRESAAQIFDAPDFTPSLWRIGSVEIQYAAPTDNAVPNPVQAFLLAGWLATRLNWEFHGTAPGGGRGRPGDFILTLRQGVRSIPIALRAVPGDTVCPGGLVNIQLTTNDVNPTTFNIALDGEGVYVECAATREGMETAMRKVRYTTPDEAGLLNTEMEQFGHDTIYEQSLTMAGVMAWASMSLGRRAEVSAALGAEQRQSSFDPRF